VRRPLTGAAGEACLAPPPRDRPVGEAQAVCRIDTLTRLAGAMAVPPGELRGAIDWVPGLEPDGTSQSTQAQTLPSKSSQEEAGRVESDPPQPRARPRGGAADPRRARGRGAVALPCRGAGGGRRDAGGAPRGDGRRLVAELRLREVEIEVGDTRFAAGDQVITRVDDNRARIYNRERWRVAEVDAAGQTVVLDGIDTHPQAGVCRFRLSGGGEPERRGAGTPARLRRHHLPGAGRDGRPCLRDG
jgi:hypothetical protein